MVYIKITKTLTIAILICCMCATSFDEKNNIPGMKKFLDIIRMRRGIVHIDVYKPGTIIEVFEGPGGYIVVAERDRSKIPNESDEDIPIGPPIKSKRK